MKKKEHMLLFDMIAKIVTTISFLLLNSKTGMFNMILAFVLILYNYVKEKKETTSKTQNIIVFSIATSIYVVILFLTYSNISSILIFTTSIISLISNQFLEPQKMRMTGIFNSILYLIYQLTLKNWAGLLEIIVIISNLTSWLKYKKET
jgi:hypothetical protein